jgi:hypothetical protein
MTGGKDGFTKSENSSAAVWPVPQAHRDNLQAQGHLNNAQYDPDDLHGHASVL